MDSHEEHLNRLFAAAEAARTAELKRALRDQGLWAEQLALLLMMAMKVVALSFICAGTLLLAGANEQLALTLGVVLVLVVLPFNPRDFFWRVLFVERANNAFNAQLQQARSTAKR